jgi:hypothetical protein
MRWRPRRSTERWWSAAGCLLVATCSAHPTVSSPSRVTVPALTATSLTVTDLAAYQRGVTREAEVARRLLGVGFGAGIPTDSVSGAIAEAGALAARVPSARYRVIEAAVDSLLRARSASPARPLRTTFVSSGADTAFEHMALQLDSLRVELIVLRLRLAERRRQDQTVHPVPPGT